MKKVHLFFSLVLFISGLGFFIYAHMQPKVVSEKEADTSQQTVLGQQIKTTGCNVNGTFPDNECTPGAIFPTVTKEQICTSGYSSSVRDVSVATKKQVYEEYGLTYPQPRGAYEVDHFISLELGGSNDISNLWPEAADPKPGFHEKDLVENYLHDQVCNGSLSLSQAQKEISTNWISVYNKIR